MEVASLIISIVALLSSVIVAIYDKRVDKKLNDITMESLYFNELYKDLLLNKIPENRLKITINYEGKLIGGDDLVKTLKEIRRNSTYFLYTDKRFYERLKNSAQELEDYILSTEDKVLEGEEQTEVLNCITNKISNIYKVMTEKCFKG